MGYLSGSYQAWGKAAKSFAYAIRGAGYVMNDMAKIKMTALAEEYLSELDSKWPQSSASSNGASFGGDKDHPWYSGQLHDSIAIRIAQANKTIAVRFMEPSAPSFPPGEPGRFLNSDGAQSMAGVDDHIVGTEYALRGINNAARYARFITPGILVQITVGVPYADILNAGTTGRWGQQTGRHRGFFDAMVDDLIVKYDDYDWNGYFNRQTLTVDEKGNVMKTRTRSRGITKR